MTQPTLGPDFTVEQPPQQKPVAVCAQCAKPLYGGDPMAFCPLCAQVLCPEHMERVGSALYCGVCADDERLVIEDQLTVDGLKEAIEILRRAARAVRGQPAIKTSVRQSNRRKALHVLANASRYLREQLATRCSNCGCEDTVDAKFRGPTGVVAPDGGREYHDDSIRVCARCGMEVE